MELFEPPLLTSKKLETEGGQRARQDLHSPGFDAKSKRNEIPTCQGNESKACSRREEPDHKQGENSREKSQQNYGRTSLNCPYTNANSLVGKVQELRIRSVGLDVIGVTESWATIEIS